VVWAQAVDEPAVVGACKRLIHKCFCLVLF
jgi:hypothetical protein